jgi:hypothetical protein
MRIKKEVYVIMYVSSYNHGNPCDQNITIYQDMFFYEYETALNYAKLKGLKYDEFEIERLILGAISKD